MNHINKPYYIHIKDNKLLYCYEFTDLKTPSIFRPKDADCNIGEMDP